MQTHDLPLEEVGEGRGPGIAIEAGLSHSSSHRKLRNSHDSKTPIGSDWTRSVQTHDLPLEEVGEGRGPGIAIKAGLSHSSSRRKLRNSHDS